MTYVDLITERINFIQDNRWFQEEGVPKATFKNSREIIQRLIDFTDFLEIDEVGTSGNGTILMNFENNGINLILDIGKTTVAHVYQDSKGKFISGSSNFADETYWSELVKLFDNLS